MFSLPFIHILIPAFPYIRFISKCCLFTISDYRCLNYLRILKYFLQFIFICNILNNRKQGPSPALIHLLKSLENSYLKVFFLLKQ